MTQTAYGWYAILDNKIPVYEDQLVEMVDHGLTGLQIATAKGSHQLGLAQQHTEIADSLGIPYSILVRTDPTDKDVARQVKVAASSLTLRNASSISVQMDIFWMDWREMIARNTHSSNGYVRTQRSDALNRWYRDYLKRLRKEINDPAFAIVGVSPKWYIHKYCRILSSTISTMCDAYIGEDPMFYEQEAPLEMTWGEFESKILSYQPLRMNIPGTMKVAGFELGRLPVLGFPAVKIGVTSTMSLFGSLSIIGQEAETEIETGKEDEESEEPEEPEPEEAPEEETSEEEVSEKDEGESE